jgi:hypothetical protein
MTLTPEFAKNSMIFVMIGYVFALAFQLYMLYLNWKQSKVRDTQQKLIDEVIKIRKLMEKK